MWVVHKRTRQGVSAKLESYIYRIHMVRAISSCLPHFLLKPKNTEEKSLKRASSLTVREVGFLGVVIDPERMKIKE